MTPDPTLPRQYYQGDPQYGVYWYAERPRTAGKDWGKQTKHYFTIIELYHCHNRMLLSPSVRDRSENVVLLSICYLTLYKK